MIFVYLIIVLLGLFIFANLFLPELRKDRIRQNYLFVREKIFRNPLKEYSENITMARVNDDLREEIERLHEKIEKLELLLEEKNSVLDNVQASYYQEKKYREEFDMMRSLMDEQIHALRAQNRSFRAQLDQLKQERDVDFNSHRDAASTNLP